MNTTWNAVGRSPERLATVGFAVTAIVVGLAVARGQGIVVIAGLASVLFALLFVWNPAIALLVYVASRPAADGFVHLPVGPLSLGQLWGAGLLVVLTIFILG